MNKDTKIYENRQKLKAISQAAKILVKSGQYGNVNEAITAIYASEGHSELKTFGQWIKSGFCVNKGEKALLLWGEPIKRKSKEKTDKEEDNESFFPICYVFSKQQVLKLEKR